MSEPDLTPVDRPQKPVAAPAGGEVRAVFLRALRDMLVLVAVLAVVGSVVGALVADPPSAGIWGAVIGVLIAVVFSGATVVSMLVTANAPVTKTAAVIMGGWVVKMGVLIATLSVLRGQDFYDRRVLVAVLVAGVLGSAFLDYRAVARGRVPYTSPAP